MVIKTLNAIKEHFMSNKYTYLTLFIVYAAGIVAGSLAVNQLDYRQRNEMSGYFNGFLKLLDSSTIDSVSLFKISLWDNLKIILLFWILGFTVIGLPVFYLVLGMEGFTTGFSSGVIMSVLGAKGVAISFTCFLPKELIIIPCLIAIGVNGVKLSGAILKGWFKKTGIKEVKIKQRIATYSFVTVFFSIFILAAIVLEAFLSPVLLKLLSSI